MCSGSDEACLHEADKNIEPVDWLHTKRVILKSCLVNFTQEHVLLVLFPFLRQFLQARLRVFFPK